jgi:hypothetical protein
MITDIDRKVEQTAARMRYACSECWMAKAAAARDWLLAWLEFVFPHMGMVPTKTIERWDTVLQSAQRHELGRFPPAPSQHWRRALEGSPSIAQLYYTCRASELLHVLNEKTAVGALWRELAARPRSVPERNGPNLVHDRLNEARWGAHLFISATSDETVNKRRETAGGVVTLKVGGVELDFDTCPQVPARRGPVAARVAPAAAAGAEGANAPGEQGGGLLVRRHSARRDPDNNRNPARPAREGPRPWPNDYPRALDVFTDGSFEAKDGRAAAAAVVWSDEFRDIHRTRGAAAFKPTWKPPNTSKSQYPPYACGAAVGNDLYGIDNNTAEMMAVLTACDA